MLRQQSDRAPSVAAKRRYALVFSGAVSCCCVFVEGGQLRKATTVCNNVPTPLVNAIRSGHIHLATSCPCRYSKHVAPRKNPVQIAFTTACTIVARSDRFLL